MDYKKFDDKTLLQLMVQKDQAALGAFYDRYSRLVFSIALRAMGDRETAEEISQDVFLRLWNSAETYRRESGGVPAWVASITRNRAIDEFRRLKVRPEANAIYWEEGEIALWSDMQGVEDLVVLSQESEKIRRSVRNLPENQKNALAYAYFLGFSHTEIARLLDEPLGTVKTRIRLAMKKIRDDLEAEKGEE